MPDTTNQIIVSGDEFQNTTVFPDTKLQTLDRRVGNDQLYFDRKLFQASVHDWSGIPIIYQPDGVHPVDFAAVERDPVAAAEAIGGTYVGTVRNPRVVVPGGARLMAELDIDENEDEIVSLWNEGKLFPSTAFMANSDGDRLTSPPIPNHVLLFPLKVDEVLPGDFGAFVNTLEVSDMKKEKDEKKICNDAAPETAPETTPEVAAETTQEQQESSDDFAKLVADHQAELAQLKVDLAEIRQMIEALKEVQTQGDAPAAEVTNTEEIVPEAAAAVAEDIDEKIKERDGIIAELKADVEGLAAGKAALEEKIKGMETAAMEAEFNTIVEKLPVGMKATPEQIEALHTQFVSGNTKEMLFSVLNSSVATGSTQKEGQPFTQSNNVAAPFGVGDLNRPRIRKEYP